MKSIKWIIVLMSTSLLLFSVPSYSNDQLSVAATTVAQAVDVNNADAETIAAQLKGVGLKKAQAIVDYRDTHGPFKTLDDLLKVKGIGVSTLGNNRDKIAL